MNHKVTQFIFLLTILGLFLISQNCQAQRENTTSGYVFQTRHIYIELDSVQKRITIITYFRGNHYITVKNGAYAIDKSRIYFGRSYSFIYQDKKTSIQITGKNTDLKYNIK